MLCVVIYTSVAPQPAPLMKIFSNDLELGFCFLKSICSAKAGGGTTLFGLHVLKLLFFLARGFLSWISLTYDILSWDQDVCSFLIFSIWDEAFLLITFLAVPLWHLVLSEQLLLWSRTSGEKPF